jgi:hypothetical protein
MLGMDEQRDAEHHERQPGDDRDREEAPCAAV